MQQTLFCFLLCRIFFNLLIIWKVTLFFWWKMNNKWTEDQHSSLLMNSYLSHFWWIKTLNLLIFSKWGRITHIIVLLILRGIPYTYIYSWRSFRLRLQQTEHACNELTTRRTTIFKSLSNYLHLLIKGNTTHQDTFTFDLIWSRKSPY